MSASPQSGVAIILMMATSGVLLGCGSPPEEEDGIKIGLILSYSGYLAANSVNSERALLMAVETANAAGGVAGRALRVVARDSRSNADRVTASARELLEAGVTVFIGPDTTDLVTQLRTLLGGRTMLLPSFATASDVEFKPPSWFVMGPGIARVACEINAQLRADGRKSPMAIVNPTGYTSAVSWDLGNTYGLPKLILPTERVSTTRTAQPIISAQADAFVLAAFPESASSLIYALATAGALPDPTRWYLLPTLHTPAFLDTIPRGAFVGARGVSPGTVAGAVEFRRRFRARWHDAPLDDAYPFYDAGAVAILAMARAMAQEGTIPTGNALGKHVVAVTRSGGTRILWDELERGLTLLREGREVDYIGLTGQIAFDLAGQTQAGAGVNWWTIGPNGIDEIPHVNTCR